MVKLRAFQLLWANKCKRQKKWKKIKKIYFPGPPYSLQKASYSLQFFLYVTLKHIVLLYAKIAGFLAIMGYFRTHTKENHIFSLIWACWPTVGGGVVRRFPSFLKLIFFWSFLTIFGHFWHFFLLFQACYRKNTVVKIHWQPISRTMVYLTFPRFQKMTKLRAFLCFLAIFGFFGRKKKST